VEYPLDLNHPYWYKYIKSVDPKIIESIIREEILTSEKLQIHLDVYDQPIEKPSIRNVIFIHGTAIYSRFYAEFCYNLWLKGFRVFAPDLPGHGLSGGSRGYFTMKLLTDSISHVVKYIRTTYPGKICLMGSSLGGIATLYTALSSTSLDMIICHNAALFHEDAYKSIVKVGGFLNLLIKMVPFFSKIVPKLRLSVFLYLPRERLASTSEGLEAYNKFVKDPLLARKYTLLSLYSQMNEAPHKSIEELEIPVLFINGENDQLFTPRFIEGIFKRISSKNKKLVILKRAEHLIFQQNIPEVLDEILLFLR